MDDIRILRDSSLVIDIIAWLLLMIVPVEEPCRILDLIDESRAVAFATQNEQALERLYETPEGARADLAMLVDYRERRLRIVGIEMERQSCETSDRLEVQVVERLASTQVEFQDGTIRTLPTGEWKQRRITFVYDGWWRIRSTTENIE